MQRRPANSQMYERKSRRGWVITKHDWRRSEKKTAKQISHNAFSLLVVGIVRAFHAAALYVASSRVGALPVVIGGNDKTMDCSIRNTRLPSYRSFYRHEMRARNIHNLIMCVVLLCTAHSSTSFGDGKCHWHTWNERNTSAASYETSTARTHTQPPNARNSRTK